MSKAFDKVIGIVGNPSHPDVAWSDGQLEALRGIGIDTLQLSVAWSWKPENEVLNLEDLDDTTTAALYKSRVEKSHRFGFKALGHFGVPKALDMNAFSPRCIMDPAVIEDYQTRLMKFFAEYGADEAMIYTYDQRAWLCSEFGDCPRCKGIPLHERLPAFLEALAESAQRGKPGATLWWEPWELSEGQIIEVVDRIRLDHFGIIMHSNIGEVGFANTVDLPSRNIARAAMGRGIPFISEGFFGGSGEDVETINHMPCPRLVWQQLDSMRRTRGLTGVKEYYGFVPSDFSVNVALFSAYLQTPERGIEELLEPIAKSYGPGAGLLLEAWELASQGMELFPYNASWWLRFLLARPDTQEWKRIREADWETPSWKSSRRAYYMVTDETRQHPWLLEDVGLRAKTASRKYERAAELLREAESGSFKPGDIRLQRMDLQKLAAAAGKFGESLYNARV